MEIKTKRLLLREYKESDASDLLEYLKDIEVSKYLSSVPHPCTIEYIKSLIDYAIQESKNKKRENYELGIEYSGKIIGMVMLGMVNKSQGTCFLHYDLNRKYWRKGFGYEATSAILNYAFKNLNLKKIESNPFADNLASRKLLEKLGFKKSFLIPKNETSKATGTVHDVQAYVLEKADWKNSFLD